MLLALAAALCPLMIGCETAAVQVADFALATPSPTPQVISIQEIDEQTAQYGITVVTQYEGELQEDEAGLAEESERMIVLDMIDPTPTEPLTPSPVPTAPPDTPTPAPSPTPTPTEEPEPTPKATEKPTRTPKATTPKPAATPTPKPAETPTVAPVTTLPVTPTPTAAPTATPVQTSSQTPPSVSGPYSGEDVLLAARVAYFESARSEEGYRAVVCVILNRVESGKWPNSVYDVVYQKSQFSVVGKSDFLTKTIPSSVIDYANDVLNNGNRLLPADVMSFRSASEEKDWGSRTFFGTYGGNDFYS